MDKKNTKTSSKLPNQTPLFGVVDIQWLVSHIKEVQILRQEHQANLAALQQWVKATTMGKGGQCRDSRPKYAGR